MSGTTDMTSWDLGQQEEDLENSKFRERAFHESIYSSLLFVSIVNTEKGVSTLKSVSMILAIMGKMSEEIWAKHQKMHHSQIR